MEKTLIIGYGNIDRQDDGAAWFVIQEIARRLGRDFSSEPMDEIEASQEQPTFYFTLQLTPELAEDIAEYERVCFIDAHTGNIPEDLQVKQIIAQFQNSPFTHHLTPESLLSLCLALYKKEPSALLVSVRGYEFDFLRGLSHCTKLHVKEAITHICKWIKG